MDWLKPITNDEGNTIGHRPAKRTRDRRKDESRSKRVQRHAGELAAERGISRSQASAVLQTGNPLAPAPREE